MHQLALQSQDRGSAAHTAPQAAVVKQSLELRYT
jgi:hypothetical protein